MIKHNELAWICLDDFREFRESYDLLPSFFVIDLKKQNLQIHEERGSKA